MKIKTNIGPVDDPTVLPQPDAWTQTRAEEPRYTSYPAPGHFTKRYDARRHRAALASRALCGPLRPLALYVHVPFCASACHYCSCPTVITTDTSHADRYLTALRTEAQLVKHELTGVTPITRLSIGGGTPTFLEDDQLRKLVYMLEATYAFSHDATRYIEVDPRTVDANRLGLLHELSFDHIGVGAQDFNAHVLAAVNRRQAPHQPGNLVREARRLGFKSVSMDIICGLPRQTPASFADTIKRVIDLAPDSLTIYPYHHRPDRYKTHKALHPAALPRVATTNAMLLNATAQLADAGWVHLGMQQFVRDTNPLAVAKREGRLHRNFQGYTTQHETDLIGLGVSAISRIGTTYARNVSTIADYYAAIESGRMAIEKGHALNADDLLRQAVIMGIVCHGEVNISILEETHFVSFNNYFQHELQALYSLQNQGWIRFEPDGFVVTESGSLHLSAIARVFDRYDRNDHVCTALANAS